MLKKKKKIPKRNKMPDVYKQQFARKSKTAEEE